MPPAMPLLEGHQIDYCPGGHAVLQGLSASVRPGLTWVVGGEGRGKTVLLRLMAGQLEPSAGQLWRHAASVCLPQMTDPSLDAVPARAWLQDRQCAYPAWDAAQAAAWTRAFGLTEHLDKPLYMLSAGSRRKVGLVAAGASGAELTLLDQPFTALDAASCRVLLQCLAQAAVQDRRAWVVADYAVPTDWDPGLPCHRIDLGD